MKPVQACYAGKLPPFDRTLPETRKTAHGQRVTQIWGRGFQSIATEHRGESQGHYGACGLFGTNVATGLSRPRIWIHGFRH